MSSSPSPSLPDPRVQTGVWSVAAVIATSAVLTTWPLTVGTPSSITIGLLAVASLAASSLGFEAQARIWGREVQQMISLTESALVLLLLTVPPGWAWSLTLAGYVVSNVLRSPNLLRNLFNGAVWAVSLTVAVGLHELLRPTDDGITPAAVAAVTAAVLVHTVVNYVAVSLVVSASTGSDVRRELASTAALEPWITAGTISIGIVAAAAWQVAPWSLLFVGLIALIMRHGYRQFVAAQEAADQLGIQRDHLDEVVAATEQGLVLADQAGRVVLWNAAMVRLTGIDEDSAVHRDLREVLADRLTLDATPSTDSDATTGTSRSVTSGWLIDEDGQRRRVDVRRAAQQDRLGADISEVVQFRDRTTEYEVARLKDDFLSRVSHELRTPLTTIIGFARTLQAHRDQLDAATVERMEEGVIRRSRELATLVDDLLLVARTRPGIDTGGAPMVALGPIVERAVDEEQRRAPGRAIELEVTAMVRVTADTSAVSTIVRHLVSNAVKFSPDDTTVDVQVTAGASDTAIVRIVDRGRGIPRARQQEIFGRFTRLEDPLRMETRGAGMGLHVVDRLVADLGGRIEVDSTPGHGATFTVHLPGVTDRPEPGGDDQPDPGDDDQPHLLRSTVRPS